MKDKKNSDKKIIALIGLMGVGKTTIGNRLAQKLQYYFIDSDQEIEDRQKMSIAEIFNSKGEEYFRDVEEKVVKDIISRDENLVLSLGGGSFMNEKIRQALKEKAIVIWIDAPIDVILHRVSGKKNRPLLNDNKVSKRKILENLAKQRNDIYAQADFKFNSFSEQHDSLVNKIIDSIKL